MKYYSVSPGAKLADFVHYFWILEGTINEDQSYTLRTTASPFPELIFHYRGTFAELLSNQKSAPSFSSGIHGQTNRHRQFTINENFGMIGAQLYPYALKTLFNIPAIEFANELPELSSFLRPADHSISRRIFEATDNNKRIQIISTFLETRISEFKRPEIVYAVQEIIKNNGSLAIKQLAADCCNSQRQFERNFKDLTGFTAKSFSRIVRFNALQQTADFKKQSLTQIALQFGYYDQAHFINDCKEFSGLNPVAYFSEKSTPQ
ncbi:MAG: AraC family transcriptional regulator [Rhizobacter sp.]|nr:AraC family transcriptional regulator [Ferruginibacter sp.]